MIDIFFGNWLSGFVDGEGCFQCIIKKRDNLVQPKFSLHLRCDDLHILKDIKRFLGCGHIYFYSPSEDCLKKITRSQGSVHFQSL